MMKHVQHSPGVMSVCVIDGAVKRTLAYLSSQTDVFMKDLAGFLSSKRLAFPRFFFISDDALLKILGGQSGDWSGVNSNLTSLFNGISRLAEDPIHRGRIVGVWAAGTAHVEEFLELNDACNSVGGSEVWLKDVERQVKASVKRRLMVRLIQQRSCVHDTCAWHVITAISSPSGMLCEQHSLSGVGRR